MSITPFSLDLLIADEMLMIVYNAHVTTVSPTRIDHLYLFPSVSAISWGSLWSFDYVTRLQLVPLRSPGLPLVPLAVRVSATTPPTPRLYVRAVLHGTERLLS